MYLPLSSAFPGELPTGLHVYHLYLNAPGTPSASRLGSPPRTFLSSALPEDMHVLFPSLPLSLTLATSSPSPLTLGQLLKTPAAPASVPTSALLLPWVLSVHHQGACDTWPVLGWVPLFMNSFRLGCLSAVGKTGVLSALPEPMTELTGSLLDGGALACVVQSPGPDPWYGG